MKFICEKHFYLILFVCFCLLGITIVSVKGHKSFNQNRFEAVVMKACTGKLQTIDPAQQDTVAKRKLIEELSLFEMRKQLSFSCDVIEDSIAFVSRDPNLFSKGPSMFSVDLEHAYAHYYMANSIALLWQVFGVHWYVVNILYVLLFAMSALCAVLLFRLIVPEKWAIVMTLILHLHPDFIDNYLRLRDFSKIPFILMVLWGTAALIRGVEAPKQFWGVLALIGLSIGVGSGFRSDVLLTLPLVLFSLFFLLSCNWRRRCLSVLVLLSISLTLLLPVLAHAPAKSNMAHVLLLGHMDHFNQALDIEPGSYSLGAHYIDSHICMNIKQKAAIQGKDLPGCYNTDYAEAGTELYLDYITLTPGNVLSRSVASFIQILKRDYPRTNNYIGGYFTLIAFLSTCILLSGFHFRGALFYFLSAGYLGGTSALLYDLRHINHLNVYLVLAFGYCLFLGYRYHKSKQKYKWNKNNTAMVIVITGACILMGAGVYSGRVVQAKNFVEYNDTLTSLPRHKINLKVEKIFDDMERIYPKGVFLGQEDKFFQLALLRFVFDPAKCEQEVIDLISLYPSQTPLFDTSMIHRLRFSSKDIGYSFYTPVYIDNRKSKFDSFAMSSEDRKCLVKVEQLAELSKLKVLLHYWLSDKPSPNDTMQRLSDIEAHRKFKYKIVKTTSDKYGVTVGRD